MEQVKTPKHVFMTFEFYSAIVQLLGKMPCEAAGQVWAGLNQGQVRDVSEYIPVSASADPQNIQSKE